MPRRSGALFWLSIVMGSALAGVIGPLVYEGFLHLWTLMKEGLEKSPASVLIFPLLGVLASYLLVDTFAKTRVTGSATGMMIANYHTGGKMSLRDSVVKSVASIATVGFGGTAGPEAPGIFLGAGMTQAIARLLRVEGKSGRLLLAGAAAGLTSVFKTPVTGVLYALETPYTRELEKEPFLEAALAASVAYAISAALTGPSPILAVHARVAAGATTLLHSVAIGVLAGSYSLLFSKAYSAAGKLSSRLIAEGGFPAAVLAGGITLSLIGFVNPDGIGHGLTLLPSTVSGHLGVETLIILLVLRTVSVIVTLGFGGVGGLFLPTLVDGALIGALYSSLLGLGPISFYAMVGAASALAGCFKTLLAPVTLVAESAGIGLIVPVLLAAGASYTIALAAPLFRFQLPTAAREEELLLERLYLRLRGSRPLRETAARKVMMRSPLNVKLGDKLEDAMGLMVATGLRVLPVVDVEGRVTGQLSLEDITWLGDKQLRAPVSSAPLSRPLAVEGDSSLEELLGEMLTRGVHHAYIVDKGGRLLGVVSTMDIVRAMMPYLR